MMGLSQTGSQPVVDNRNARPGRSNDRIRNPGEAYAAGPRKYFRKEFGWAMDKTEVEAWKKFKVNSAKAADKYKKDYVDPANESYSSALQSGRGAIDSAYANAERRIPQWQEPSYTRVRLAGDGDPGQDYMVLNENLDAFVGAFKNDYYKVVPQNDGSYHIHLKEYGKEGYDTANEYIGRQNTMINNARRNFNDERNAARGVLDSGRRDAYGTFEANLEAEAGPGLRTLESNHQRLVNQYKDKVAETKEIADRKREMLNKSVLNTETNKATVGRRGLSEEI